MRVRWTWGRAARRGGGERTARHGWREGCNGARRAIASRRVRGGLEDCAASIGQVWQLARVHDGGGGGGGCGLCGRRRRRGVHAEGGGSTYVSTALGRRARTAGMCGSTRTRARRAAMASGRALLAALAASASDPAAAAGYLTRHAPSSVCAARRGDGRRDTREGGRDGRHVRWDGRGR